MDIDIVTTEAINDRFARGKFLYMPIIVDKSTNYINATNLCDSVLKMADQVSQWRRSSEGMNYIEELSNITCKSEDELVYDVTESQFCSEVHGTYIHPYLIDHLIRWADICFAIFVTRLLWKETMYDQIKRLREGSNKKDNATSEVYDQINKMREESNKNFEILMHKLNTLREHNKIMISEASEINRSLKVLSKDLND